MSHKPKRHKHNYCQKVSKNLRKRLHPRRKLRKAIPTQSSGKKRIPKAPNPKPFFCTQEAEENPRKNHYDALLQNSEQQKREEDQIKALENSKIANTTDRHTDHV
jgi:hypothetical protein